MAKTSAAKLAASRAWKLKNKDRVKAYLAIWREQNREHIRKYENSRERRVKLREYRRIKAKERYYKSPERRNYLNSYRVLHPEIGSIAASRKRARIKKAAGNHTSKQWLWRVEYYGWKCFYCKIELNGSTVTREHRIALALGGSNWASNLVPACKPCNCKGGAAIRRRLYGKQTETEI